MPLQIDATAPTLLIRRDAFERANLTRSMFDESLTLTADEFRIEGAVIAIGPLHGEHSLSELLDTLESAGLTYFEDFFELSGNWPEWLRLFVMESSS